jgi:hypothetical protein
MQNKPNFRKSQMNVNAIIIKDYENKTLSRRGKNKPKQTQFKANQSQLKPIKCQNKPNSNPNKANFKGCRLFEIFDIPAGFSADKENIISKQKKAKRR